MQHLQSSPKSCSHLVTYDLYPPIAETFVGNRISAPVSFNLKFLKTPLCYPHAFVMEFLPRGISSLVFYIYLSLCFNIVCMF